MFDLIYKLPDQIEDARRIAKDIKLPGLPIPKNIVISGMGGSGIGGEILQSVFSYYSEIPVLVVKDYALPKFVTKQTLFFTVSYSGNTEEILSAYQQAKKTGCKVICLTSDGKLLNRAKRHKDLWVKIPNGYPPRSAIGYLFIPFLVLLNKMGFIRNFDREISETIKVLISQRNFYQNQAQKIALELRQKIPFIYSTSRLLNPVANRWRTQINELAKVFAHTSYFPEHNHNEIVGMGGPAIMKSLTYLLILIDPEGHPRNRLRADLTVKITKGSFFKARKFFPDGKSAIARVFSLIMQGDLLSYYLASERNVDPLPVVRIDKLKSLMAKR